MGNPKDIKPGDEVTIKVIARSPRTGMSPYYPGVLYYGRPGDALWGHQFEIVEFKAPERPWAVGDRYTTGLPDNSHWEILYIDDLSVFVNRVTDNHRAVLSRKAFPGHRVRVHT